MTILALLIHAFKPPRHDTIGGVYWGTVLLDMMLIAVLFKETL